MSDGFDEVAAFGAVVAFRLRRSTRRQVPLHTITFTTSRDLAARPHNRPPQNTFGSRRGWFGLDLGRRLGLCLSGRLAAAIGGGVDRGCSHGDDLTPLDDRAR